MTQDCIGKYSPILPAGGEETGLRLLAPALLISRRLFAVSCRTLPEQSVREESAKTR